MEFIELQNVNLTFKTKVQLIPIFKGLNLSIAKGEFLVIAGPSGRGKSTLLNLVSGLVKPNSGKIFVDGVDTGTLSEKRLCDFRNKEIGYMFQNFNLIQQFNIRDNVATPLILSGMRRKKAYAKAEELLEQVGLTGRKLEYPRTLSGGEQQRVAFARAISNSPRIILADEPTANLDTKNGQNLIELLHRLSGEQGLTVLCVSHDSRVIEQGDRVIDIEAISCVD
jgi:putative ABC transport system ATP-binding protein